MTTIPAFSSVTGFLFSVLLTCFSCAPEAPERPARVLDQELVKVDELSLALDRESSYEVFQAQYLEAGGEAWLFTMNHLINAVNMYSLRDGRLAKKVRFPREGPHSVRQIQGFLALSLDSILILPRGNLMRAIMVDTAGALVREAPLAGAEWEGSPIINHASNANAPPVYHRGRFYFVQYPLFDIYHPGNIDDRFEFSLVYDPGAKRLSGGGIRYPTAYQGKIWPAYAHAPGQVKGHGDWFVYNWPFSGDLHVTDRQSRKWVAAAVSPAPPPPRPYSGVPDQAAEIRTMLEHVTYKRLYYDPFRRLYYRMALLPTAYSADRHRDYRAFEEQPIKVITLDERFEVIAETALPNRTYGITTCFVGRAGLYIPQINAQNEDLDEDVLTYSVYQIKPKQQ